MRRHAKAIVAISALGLLTIVLGAPGALASASGDLRTSVTDPGAIPGLGFLPEGRAWEKVSPSEKDNADVYSRDYATKSSRDGNRVMYGAYGGFAGSEANKYSTPYRASRDGNGDWSSSGIYAPAKGVASGNPTTLVDLSPDLSQAVVETPTPLTPDASTGLVNRYVRQIGTSSFTLLNSPPLSSPNSIISGEAFLGASADYSRLFFSSGSSLAGGAPELSDSASCGSNIYERSGGSTRLVSRLPDPDGEGPLVGEPALALPVASPLGPCSVTYTDPAAQYERDSHLISDDGQRIFWSAASDSQLYLRQYGTETLHVSASHLASPEAPRPAQFQEATPDGSKVLFTSCERLTEDSTAGGGGSCADLYMFDVVSGGLTDVAPSPNPGEAAAVVGVVGMSDDGARVYFAADGSLTPSAPAGGFPKVYLWDDGKVTYIAELDGPNQFSEPTNFLFNAPGAAGGAKGSRVSADGRFMTLVTPAELTSDQTEGTKQVYVYDATTGDLLCASCVPGGTTRYPGEIDRFGNGLSAQIVNVFLNTGLLPGGGVLFHTQTALVPEDTNSQIDVYLWRPGVGPRLISSGQSRYPSYFEDASADGRDVFFTTRERLTPSDRDDNVDLYDARIGGGKVEVDAAANDCGASNCREQGESTGAAQVPASMTLTGSAHQTARKAKRRACRVKQRQKRSRCAHGKRRHKQAHGKRVGR